MRIDSKKFKIIVGDEEVAEVTIGGSIAGKRYPDIVNIAPLDGYQLAALPNTPDRVFFSKMQIGDNPPAATSPPNF